MRGQVRGMALYSIRDRTGGLRSDEAREGHSGRAGSDGGVKLAGNRVGLAGERGWTRGGTEGGQTGGERDQTSGRMGSD